MYIYKPISLGREILKSEIVITFAFGCFLMHWADLSFYFLFAEYENLDYR